jgi:invasion protein IalB
MQANRIRLITAAAVGLALAAPAAAQEPAAPAEEPVLEAPAAGDAPASALPSTGGETAADAPAATGAPVAAAPAGTAPADAAAPGAAGAGGQATPEVLEIVRETFGDWEIRCAPEGDECFMYQLALDAQENPVAEFSLLKLPLQAEATAGVTVVTPLGTLLPAGLVLQIDSGERRQYPFSWCSQVGCFARFGLDETSVSALKRGNRGKVTLVSVGAPQSPVTLDVSLSGFTAAFDSLALPEAAPAPAEGAAPAAGAAPAPAATAAPAQTEEPAPAD